MGPLQLVSHVVQKHLTGEQEMHWEKNKQRKFPFIVCFVPADYLLFSKVFLYHITDQLQRAYFTENGIR